MLRTTFIALSESPSLRALAERSRLGQRTSARFVAGKEVADAIRAAVRAVFSDRRLRTRDMGGALRTGEMTDSIIAALP